jgi:hypothetical protein
MIGFIMARANLGQFVPSPDSISADDARALATDFLLGHVGNQLTAGQPLRMISAVRSTWIVPVQLAYIHSGVLGNVGVVAVDEETGQVVGWTPFAQMKEASCQLREQHEPAFSTQFATMMTSNSE